MGANIYWFKNLRYYSALMTLPVLDSMANVLFDSLPNELTRTVTNQTPSWRDLSVTLIREQLCWKKFFTILSTALASISSWIILSPHSNGDTLYTRLDQFLQRSGSNYQTRFFWLLKSRVLKNQSRFLCRIEVRSPNNNFGWLNDKLKISGCFIYSPVVAILH